MSMGDGLSWAEDAVCRGCGVVTDTVTEIYGAAGVRPGDVMLCPYCGEMSVYEGGWRPVTAAERAELLADQRVADVAFAARIVMGERTSD